VTYSPLLWRPCQAPWVEWRADHVVGVAMLPPVSDAGCRHGRMQASKAPNALYLGRTFAAPNVTGCFRCSRSARPNTEEA
jgi:hypothetical protein